MTFITCIANNFNRQRLKQIDFFRKNPEEVQEAVFRNLISRAARTEWGILHDYAGIKTIKQYQERIPVQEYEDILPYIERLRKGEKNLLWPGEVKWFAKSSGTTGTRSKFIPVTRDSLYECHYQ